MDVDFEYADMHFALADGTKRSAHIAIMTANSSAIRAAVRFARSGGKLDDTLRVKDADGKRFSFDLREWSVEAVDRVIDIVYHRFRWDNRPNYTAALWIETIKLAHYLGLKDINTVINHSPDKLDATQLIEVAVSLSLGKMIAKIRLKTFTGIELLAAIAQRSVADILWVLGETINDTRLKRQILRIGISTRTTTAEVDTLLIHLLSFECKRDCEMLLDADIKLTPVSRRFLEHIAGRIKLIPPTVDPQSSFSFTTSGGDYVPFGGFGSGSSSGNATSPAPIFGFGSSSGAPPPFGKFP